MYKFRSKPESSRHLDISFEFYPAEKTETRKTKHRNRQINQNPGFRSIPFQSKYALQLNYMQRPKKNVLIRSLLSWHI